VIHGRELSDRSLQLDELDGLRGLAVLIVFLSHTSNRGVWLIPHGDFSGIGKCGVYLFFVLSSFLLTIPFIRDGEAAWSRSALLHYLARRVIRIYPLYVLYLAVPLVILGVVGPSRAVDHAFAAPHSVRELTDQLLLRSAKGVTWSILVECRYYVVLPFVAFMYARLCGREIAPSLALTALLIAAAEYAWPQGAMSINDARLGPYLSTFVLGSMLAVIHHRWPKNGFDAGKTMPRIVEACGVAALVALVCLIPSVASTLSGRSISKNQFHDQPILFGVLWSLVLFACAHGNGALRRFFRMKWLRYVGFISFSVYLLHVVAIETILRVAPGIWLRGWVMLAVTVAMSHLTWIIIERPTSKMAVWRSTTIRSRPSRGTPFRRAPDAAALGVSTRER
jgi:peptidoglycan/LPS O-acetylase OafA/YrhL